MKKTPPCKNSTYNNKKVYHPGKHNNVKLNKQRQKNKEKTF